MVVAEVIKTIRRNMLRCASLRADLEELTPSVEDELLTIGRPVWRFDNFVGSEDGSAVAAEVDDFKDSLLAGRKSAAAAGEGKAHSLVSIIVSNCQSARCLTNVLVQQ